MEFDWFVFDVAYWKFCGIKNLKIKGILEFTSINKIDYFILVTIFKIWFARFLEFTPINKIDDKNEFHKNDDKIGVNGGVTTYMNNDISYTQFFYSRVILMFWRYESWFYSNKNETSIQDFLEIIF